MSCIKVHFAGAEQTPTFIPAQRASGCRYALLTAYPFICSNLGYKAQNFFRKYATYEQSKIPSMLSNSSKHVILDSGLFTLMFGAHGGKKTKKQIEIWFNALCDFISENVPTRNFSCVEVDCQKVLSPEDAWFFREEMKRRLPKHDIMNVWHLEDGKYGLDKMIEFSDYICFSIPEYRANLKHNSIVQTVSTLCHYAKKKKPGIRIHLLGCTERRIIEPVNHITYSCDSTGWLSMLKYPKKDSLSIGIKSCGRHPSDPLIKRIIGHIKPEHQCTTEDIGYVGTALRWGLAMKVALEQYVSWFGNQG